MTLFQKIGREYVPVQDTKACDGLTNGSWLITVENGLTKCRKPIEDEKGLQILAAATRWLEEWLSQELIKLSAYKYGRTNQPITGKEKRAYKAFADIMGANYVVWMTKPSAHDVAREFCKKLVATISNHKD